MSCNMLGPDELKEVLTSTTAINVESWYAEGGVEFMRQIVDGRMGYIGSVQDDVPHVTGRPALTLKQWATDHRDELIAASTRNS